MFSTSKGFLLQGNLTLLEALIWMGDFVQKNKLKEADMKVYYTYPRLAEHMQRNLLEMKVLCP